MFKINDEKKSQTKSIDMKALVQTFAFTTEPRAHLTLPLLTLMQQATPLIAVNEGMPQAIREQLFHSQQRNQPPVVPLHWDVPHVEHPVVAEHPGPSEEERAQREHLFNGYKEHQKAKMSTHLNRFFPSALTQIIEEYSGEDTPQIISEEKTHHLKQSPTG